MIRLEIITQSGMNILDFRENQFVKNVPDSCFSENRKPIYSGLRDL